MLKILNFNKLFLIIVAIGILFILNSNPMMKPLFDIWQHIGNIDSLVNDPKASIIRTNWHGTWALIFRVLNIDDIFVYAKIIHRAQFIFNCLIIYYSSKLFFTSLIIKDNQFIKNELISSLALSGTIVWVTIIGTVSTFQQAWIMWYSVNYQITLSLLFMALALCVNAIVVQQINSIVCFKIFAAICILIVIYFYHAGELAYLVIYIPIFVMCFIRRKHLISKSFIYILFGIFFILFFAVRYYTDHIPRLLTLLNAGDVKTILSEIMQKGKWNVLDGGNRFEANWNELYKSTLLLFVPVVYVLLKSKKNINQNVLYFILASLVFCFIPNYIYSAGVASMVSYDGIVNRYYFASLIFLFLPLAVYSVNDRFQFFKNPINILLLVFLTMMSVFIYSKFYNGKGVYYQNVKSIQNSIYKDRVGVMLLATDIRSVENQIYKAINMYGDDKILFCADGVKSIIIRYHFRKKNVLFSRGYTYPVKECERIANQENKKLILIN